MVGIAAVLEVAIHTDLISVTNHKARTVGRNLPELVIYLCALEGSLGSTKSAEAFTLVVEVEVTVHIESDTTESYVVKTSNFNLKNVPDGYKVSVTQETVTVRVTGKAADLKNVSAESITGNIDLSGLGEGSHNIPIQFAMDTELYQVSNVSVTVVVEKKTTGETGTGNQNNTPNDNNQETGGSGDNNLNTDTEQNETNSDATGANVTAGAGSIHTRNQ